MQVKIFIILGLVYLFSCSAFGSEEYWGEFKGDATFTVNNRVEGRPTFVLTNDFIFEDPNGHLWKTPSGWDVDGASIPKAAWSFVGGPLSGKYLYASIIHDYYCDTRERTAHDTHRNFYYGMLANGVSKKKAGAMYWAVRTFGPSWKVVKRPINRGILKSTKYVLETVDIPSPKLDEAQIKLIFDGINSEVSLDKLDSYSDSVRQELDTEALQIDLPTLQNNERYEFDKDLRIDSLRQFERMMGF